MELINLISFDYARINSNVLLIKNVVCEMLNW